MDQSSALAASIVVEGATVAILLAGLGWRKLVRGVAVAALSTVATHPFAWWSIQALEPLVGYGIAVGAVEALVCLAEAIAYRFMLSLRWPAAVLVSAGANGASTLTGLLYAVTGA